MAKQQKTFGQLIRDEVARIERSKNPRKYVADRVRQDVKEGNGDYLIFILFLLLATDGSDACLRRWNLPRIAPALGNKLRLGLIDATDPTTPLGHYEKPEWLRANRQKSIYGSIAFFKKIICAERKDWYTGDLQTSFHNIFVEQFREYINRPRQPAMRAASGPPPIRKDHFRLRYGNCFLDVRYDELRAGYLRFIRKCMYIHWLMNNQEAFRKIEVQAGPGTNLKKFLNELFKGSQELNSAIHDGLERTRIWREYYQRELAPAINRTATRDLQRRMNRINRGRAR